jgi:hypothetical protein
MKGSVHAFLTMGGSCGNAVQAGEPMTAKDEGAPDTGGFPVDGALSAIHPFSNPPAPSLVSLAGLVGGGWPLPSGLFSNMNKG